MNLPLNMPGIFPLELKRQFPSNKGHILLPLTSQFLRPFLTFPVVLAVSCSWNEWLRLPVKYPDLPQSAQVALTVWDIYGPGRAVPVGGTTVTLFGKYG